MHKYHYLYYNTIMKQGVCANKSVANNTLLRRIICMNKKILHLFYTVFVSVTKQI